EVIPEERDAEGAVGAGERPPQALFVVDVGGDDFRAGRGERLRLVGAGIAGYRARPELTAAVGKNRPDEPVALRAGGADDRNHVLVSHVLPPAGAGLNPRLQINALPPPAPRDPPPAPHYDSGVGASGTGQITRANWPRCRSSRPLPPRPVTSYLAVLIVC